MEDEARSLRRRRLQVRRRRGRLALVGIAAVVAAVALAAGLAFGGGSRKAAPPPAPERRATRIPVPKGRPARPLAPARRTDTPVPILMYHVLDTPPAGAPYPELYVRPADFTAQMDWLARRGFHAVTLRQAYDHWRRGRPLPAHPIVVTFDDGYRSVYTVALPVLRRHGFPGVLNLAVEHQWTDLPPRFVWKLIGAGWELDDHTFTHPDLTTLDAAVLEREIGASRRFLQKQYHQPIPFFCYPSGRYDAAVLAAVRRAGYLGATTTNAGIARPSQGLFTLDRVRIDRSDGVAGFARKLGPAA